jgi:hypothetical protein
MAAADAPEEDTREAMFERQAFLGLITLLGARFAALQASEPKVQLKGSHFGRTKTSQSSTA